MSSSRKDKSSMGNNSVSVLDNTNNNQESLVVANKSSNEEPHIKTRLGDPELTNDGVCSDNNEEPLVETRLSKQRWLILFAICLFALNSSLTDELSPILHTMLDLLELPLHKYVYISQVFSYLPILLTVPTAWFIDRYGLRVAMYVATLFMLIRNFSKALLFNPDIPHWEEFKFIYWIITNMAGWQTISLYYCTPLKISENWFAVSERSIAWTVMMSSSDIGYSIAGYSLPRIIHTIRDVKPLFYLNIGGAIITTVAVLVCITKSKPKYPPSERMIQSSVEHIPYFKSVKRMLRQKDVMLHLFHEAIFLGVFVSATTVIQDILTASGHTEIFVGNLISINALLSVVVLVSLASLVHRVANITLICKLGSITKATLLICHLFSMLYNLSDWFVLAVSIVFNVFRCWSSPNSNNMTAHLACGLVSQATIAGFATTITMITMTINQVVFVSLINNSIPKKPDYTHSIIYASVIALVNSMVYLLFFDGKNTRNVDRGNNNEEIEQGEENQTTLDRTSMLNSA